MRIGIDARFYGPSGKGLGRYTQEVVDNIISLSRINESGFQFVIFLSPDNFDEFVISDDRVEKVKVTCPWYSWREQFEMPRHIRRAKLDLVHFPHFNVPIFVPTKFVVTIHDLILTHFPTMRATTKSRLVYYFKNLAYRFVLSTALRQADKIITVSQFTKEDIIANFKVRPDKIAVTYEGAADLSSGSDTSFCAKIKSEDGLIKTSLPDDFLLYVGSAYPHKNLERLLSVFSRFEESGSSLYLVLAGKSDYFYDRLKKEAERRALTKKEGSRVIFAGYVPDKELIQLYSHAKAYIFPSLYEGFGLPPLEAMSMSCPVLSSSSASLPEILGDAALYFNPEDEKDIIAKINLVLSNEELREELVKKGRERIKMFDWKKCAQETIDIYLEAVK